MFKHVARTPIAVNLKSGRFIRVPAQPPTSCVTVGVSFPSFLCCARSWAPQDLAFCDALSGNPSSARQLDRLLEK